MIIDISGYFSPCLKELSESHEIKNYFLGIIEDTENGQQKYIHEIQKHNNNNIPIVSVARSPIKDSEDINVGLSIVRATDSILRSDAHTILERVSPMGVIGFGKIGRSIVQSLLDMGIRDITVCEIDSNRAREAANRPYNVKVILRNDIKAQEHEFIEFLANNRLIFCASGSKSLKKDDFKHLGDNVFISSCTSADDEFDLNWLVANAYETQSRKTGNISI